MSTPINNEEVVFFALSQCTTGNELLEYIDSFIEENSAVWLLTTVTPVLDSVGV